MATVIDTSNEYLTWARPETVTYYAKSNGVNSAGVSVTHTQRFNIRKDFLPPDSFLLSLDTHWRMAAVPLGAIVPKIDDVFQDSTGARWVVKLVEPNRQRSSYRLSCKKIKSVA